MSERVNKMQFDLGILMDEKTKFFLPYTSESKQSIYYKKELPAYGQHCISKPV